MCFGQNRSGLIKNALSGDARSQLSLGELYLAEDNYPEALRFYRLAAAQELPEAECALGNMYRYGQGVSQDYKEAVRWYGLAAAKGWPEAQFNLGVMHDNKSRRRNKWRQRGSHARGNRTVTQGRSSSRSVSLVATVNGFRPISLLSSDGKLLLFTGPAVADQTVEPKLFRRYAVNLRVPIVDANPV